MQRCWMYDGFRKRTQLDIWKKVKSFAIACRESKERGETVSSQTPLRNPALGEDYCYIHLHLNINFRTSIIFSTMSSCRKDFQSCGARNQAN